MLLLIIQLFFIGVLSSFLLGVIINKGQKLLKLNIRSSLIFMTVLTVGFYIILSYYFSKSVEYYAFKHNHKMLATIIALFLLSFLLFGPSKYSDFDHQKKVIIFSSFIGITFYSVNYFYPEFGELIFGWLPIFIWT